MGTEGTPVPLKPGSAEVASLAEAVRFLRERALLTQAELARRSGVSVRTIRGVESGRIRRPRSASMRQLVDTLCLSDQERLMLVTATQGQPIDATAPGVGTTVPAQLPAAPQAFTGRGTEVSNIEAAYDPTTMTVVLIDGMAGVGKTALAIQAAYRLAAQFNDGQLFLDLHGHTPGVAPVHPADAADRMLRALGVPGARIPPDFDERTALLRTALAGRRVLVVLDNASTEAQVRPLLPGAAGCLVLITSRRRLTGLDPTLRISLDLLPADDARTMFAHTSGTSPPADVLAEIVELCGRLPLALRIAAARLHAHPTWTPADLAARLRDYRHRLAELDAGDRSVKSAIDLSYRDLTADHQRCYRLLGLHSGLDVDSYATAALTGTTQWQAHRLLDDLSVAHLLTEYTPGRYRFHDLVRAHAAGVAERDESGLERHAAVGRMLDHYAHTAAVAIDHIYPQEADRRPPLSPPSSANPRLADSSAATRWLDDELANLLATAASATAHGRHDYTVALSAILHSHLRVRGQNDSAHRLHLRALDAARTIDDRTGELNALVNVGDILILRGELGSSDDHLQQALAIARDIGYVAGETAALLGLGAVAYYQARHDLATDRLEQAGQIARAAGLDRSELRALGYLGHIHRLLGHPETAAAQYRHALTIARSIGDRHSEIKIHVGLGHLYRSQDRLDAASDAYDQAHAIARADGDRDAERHTLWGIATVHRLGGRHQAAINRFEQLLELAQRIGSRNSEFEACHGLGHSHRAAGRPKQAQIHHERALQLAHAIHQPDDQARAHDGLALAHRALGDTQLAVEHWRAGLAILSELGLTQVEEINADDIRSLLAKLEEAGYTG